MNEWEMHEWEVIAKDMCGGEIPEEVRTILGETNRFIMKRGGILRSRQVIALEIVRYNLSHKSEEMPDA